MSLVFAAITPHPPLLVPAVGKEAAEKLKKTKEALAKLEEDLYLSHPDIIIVISPHGKITPESFSLNVCADFTVNFKEFGDLTTNKTYKGEMGLPAKIREAAKVNGHPTIMISERTLDYGVGVPLTNLTTHLPDVTVFSISFSDLDWKQHVDFGYIIKEQIMNTNKRVAVIASADLSHALTADAPAGLNPEGKRFDSTLQDLLATRNTVGLMQLEPTLVNEAAQCGFRSILILMGVLRDMHYTYQSYAYEYPFGVGYLTANFTL